VKKGESFGQGCRVKPQSLTSYLRLILCGILASGCAELPVQRHWDCPMSLNNTSPEYVAALQLKILENLQNSLNPLGEQYSVYGIRVNDQGRLVNVTKISSNGSKEFDSSVERAIRRLDLRPVPKISPPGSIEAAKIVVGKIPAVKLNDPAQPITNEQRFEPISGKVKPTYSKKALVAGMEGVVIAVATVTPTGDLSGVEIVYAEPPRIFDQAVKDARMR
jgi:TonB C terminal/Gram-negative bacterial TonB protein C-terminal